MNCYETMFERAQVARVRDAILYEAVDYKEKAGSDKERTAEADKRLQAYLDTLGLTWEAEDQLRGVILSYAGTYAEVYTDVGIYTMLHLLRDAKLMFSDTAE